MSISCPWRVAAAVLATTLLLALAAPAGADSASDEARVLSLIQQTRSSVGAPASMGASSGTTEIMLLLAEKNARSIALCSSRTLPGKV